MVSKTSNTHTMAIKSTFSAIVKTCKLIMHQLKTNNFNEEDIFAVHLALEEALVNAIKHGNKMDPDKEVKIDYSVNPNRIEISMTDEGNGFDPEAVPDPRLGENLYKNAGRGLLLMQSYMDVIEFNERGNRVHMVRYKEKPRLAGAQEQVKT